MEYQAGLHDTLRKKMLPVCIAAVKRMGATEKLAQQICSQALAVEFKNRAKRRLELQLIAFWTKWHLKHTQPGVHFWKKSRFTNRQMAAALQNIRMWRGNRLEASLCSIIVLSPVFHRLPLSFHAVTPLLRGEAQPFKCLSPHWDKSTTSRSLVQSYLAESLGILWTISRWWIARTWSIYFSSLQG